MKYNKLLIKQMRALGFKKPLTVKENQNLFEHLPDSRETMVQGNMPLVIHKVDKLLKKYPYLEYLRDDLVSVGFIALIEAIDKYRVQDKATITTCLSRNINNAFKDFLAKRMAVSIPRQTKRNAQQRGVKLDDPSPTKLSARAVRNYQKLSDLRDDLLLCCSTPEELECFQLREQQYTLKEIAVKLGTTITIIHRILAKIKKNYLTKLKNSV